MPARIPRLGWAIAFLVVAGLIAFGYANFQKASPSAPRMDKLALVPDFQFTDQYNRPLALTDLKGKVWVTDFIFTRCPGPCPIMTGHLSELNKALGDRKDVEIVSFTVDPEFDTPAVLKKYGERAGATEQRWKFLTGPREQIDKVVTKGFMQALGQDPNGLPMHSTRFLVVDRNGWIRALESKDDPQLVSKLLMDIDDLLREPQTASQK